MYMPIKPSLGIRRRISADITGNAVRQIKGKEVRLLFEPADHNQRFAKIRLTVTRRMAQRHKHLARTALPAARIVFDDGVSAVEPTLITKAFKDPFGCVSLLAWLGFVLCKPLVNLAGVRIKLGPLDRRSPPVPRRFRVRQHLRNTISADPKIPSYLTPTQTFLKVSVTHLQIQIHGEYPQALPKTERAKVADFYAARDRTVPPLPWPNIAPPFTATGLFQPNAECFRRGL